MSTRIVGKALRRGLRIGHILAIFPENLRYVPAWIGTLFRRGQRLTDPKPWLPFCAIAVIESRLPPSADVFEFGSGDSTLWLAPRAEHAVSDDLYTESLVGCSLVDERTDLSESAPMLRFS